MSNQGVRLPVYQQGSFGILCRPLLKRSGVLCLPVARSLGLRSHLRRLRGSDGCMVVVVRPALSICHSSCCIDGGQGLWSVARSISEWPRQCTIGLVSLLPARMR